MLSRESRLSSEQVSAVSELVQAATDADGVGPLSEHVLLHLRYGGDDPVQNVLIRIDGRLAAYAHLDGTDPVDGPSAELVVAPQYRRRGIGRRLVEDLLAGSPDGRLRLWAHGRQPGAAALAHALGFARERVLWQLRRSLLSPLAEPTLPPDVTIRTFQVGRDEEAWLAANNRAFAGHPDQGGWGLDEVRRREREPWFDADGFFLAERAGQLIGFHWTKVHGSDAGSSHPHGHDPIGEVYIVGVDPAAQAHGLGRGLTLIGLRYLRRRGLSQAMLYVDEANRPAIRLYESLGFTRWDVDVRYARG